MNFQAPEIDRVGDWNRERDDEREQPGYKEKERR